MPNNIIGRYYNTVSIIHDLKSTTKLICLLLYLAIIFISQSFELNMALLLITIIMVMSTNVPLKLYWRPIFTMKWLLLFIIVINLIFKSNAYAIILLLIRIINVIVLSMILIFTTSISGLSEAFINLLKPFKILRLPVNKISFVLTLAIQFIPVIVEEGNRFLKVLFAKGIDYTTLSLKGKLNILKTIIYPLFLSVMTKADNLSMSLEMRLYNLDDNRKKLVNGRLQMADYALILSEIVLFALVFVKEVRL